MTKHLQKIILTIAILLLPNGIFAAQISAKHIVNSAENKIEVYLDTEGETINVVDGSVLLDGFSSDILSISTALSPLSLWPNKPSLIGSKLTFTGGTPKGIQSKNLLLFVINLKSSVKNELRIIPSDVYIYLNNGSGDTLKVNDRTVFLVKEDIITEVARQNEAVPPEPFTIELGRDVDTYEGKYFISFFTTDVGSGVNHYEVKEGANNPVLADSPYILQDQTLRNIVYVTAYDNDGNSKVAVYKPEYKLPIKIKISIILITSLLLIGVLRILWIKIYKKRNKHV